MTTIPPHTTLMLLHRLVDEALAPLIGPMGMTHATEGYVTVDHSDLVELGAAHGDPQAVLVGYGHQTPARGLLVAEPSLCSRVLSRIWRSTRNDGTPLTHVEGEILRQFLAKIVGQWRATWQSNGVQLLPEFAMASSLSMLTPQVTEGQWHVARTVVRDGDEAVGVFLFCYPAALLPKLADNAQGITWRERIKRGLTTDERTALNHKLKTSLKDVVISAPVTIQQSMTLGTLNNLERGDIIEFDANPEGMIELSVLDRQVSGGLAAANGHLAIGITGGEGIDDPEGAPPPATADQHLDTGPATGLSDQPPEPKHDHELTPA